jgi:hypothetical protein
MSKLGLAQHCKAWLDMPQDPTTPASEWGTLAHQAIESYFTTGQLPTSNDALRDVVMSAHEFFEDHMLACPRLEQALWVDPKTFEAGFCEVKSRGYPTEHPNRIYGTADMIAVNRLTNHCHVADWKLGNLHDEFHEAQVKTMAAVVAFITGTPTRWSVATLGRLGYAVACQGGAPSVDWSTLSSALDHYPIPHGGTHCGHCPARSSCVRTYGHSKVRGHQGAVKLPDNGFSGIIETREQINALLTLGRAMPEVCTIRLSKTKLRKHLGKRASEVWDKFGMMRAKEHAPQGG